MSTTKNAAPMRDIADGAAPLRARCVGHGGVPYSPDALTPHLDWTESRLAGDPTLHKRALNGFAVLTFGADGSLGETFYDEHGGVAWQSPARDRISAPPVARASGGGRARARAAARPSGKGGSRP